MTAQDETDRLASALLRLISACQPGEYLAIGLHGREFEFVSDAAALPRRAREFAGHIPPIALAAKVMPVPSWEEFEANQHADLDARTDLEVGVRWLCVDETLLLRAGRDQHDMALLAAGAARRSTCLPALSVEAMVSALRQIRGEDDCRSFT